MTKPKLIDLVLFVACAYAMYDCLKNWKAYSQCSVPLHVYIAISICLVWGFRLCHRIGLQIAKGEVGG